MLKDLSCLHPEMIRSDVTVNSIQRLAKLLPHIISNDELPKIYDEWKCLQAEFITFPGEWYQYEDFDDDGNNMVKLKRVDHFWREVFKVKQANGQLKYPTLPKLLKTVMCIHHGNADVDRSLSDNKKIVTNHRVSLGKETLKGLRRTKELSRGVGGAHNVDINKPIIDAAKSACRVYKERLEEQRKEREAKLLKIEEEKKKTEAQERRKEELVKMEKKRRQLKKRLTTWKKR